MPYRATQVVRLSIQKEKKRCAIQFWWLFLERFCWEQRPDRRMLNIGIAIMAMAATATRVQLGVATVPSTVRCATSRWCLEIQEAAAGEASLAAMAIRGTSRAR